MNNTRQTHPETTTNTNDHQSIPMSRTTAEPTVYSNEQQMQTIVPIPSISAAVKDEEYSSRRNDDDEQRSEN